MLLLYVRFIVIAKGCNGVGIFVITLFIHYLTVMLRIRMADVCVYMYDTYDNIDAYNVQ